MNTEITLEQAIEIMVENHKMLKERLITSEEFSGMMFLLSQLFGEDFKNEVINKVREIVNHK